jgi:tetratricopeptide (TPR) repeat protein
LSMHRKPGAALLRRSLLTAILTGLAGTLGCGPSAGPEEQAEAGAVSQAANAEWSWLQETKKDLDRRRAALATLAASGTEVDPKLAREAEALSLEFNRRLVELINADPPVQGKPASERQKAAIRMKSDEEIVLARQFIEQGGDYQRAVDIYKEALAVDPGNSRLREELARAQARRYMSREAFDQVKEGMEQEEVRRLLGQPNLHNVRDYPDRGVVGWFYPKDTSGAAAAVWFRKESGSASVYLLDFNALDPRAAAEPVPPPVPAGPARPVRPAQPST